MKKAIIMLCAAVMLAGAAFAEAPELRHKLPTEWRHMERIGEGEAGSLEMARIGWSDELYGRLKESRYGSYIKSLDPGNLLSCTVFYKEIVGADEFYWQVACPETKYPFPQRTAAVIGLYYKKDGRLVFFGYCLSDYCVRVIAELTEDMGLQYRADTFQIIKGRKGAKGVVFYENFTGLNDDMTFKAIMKGAVYGGSDAEYYLPDTCITEDFRLDGRNAISIECSDFLWDERYPLHYALQNAFDGDPATSYVENTEDDLMKIDFQHLREFNVTGMAIINGYASSENLYISNNRIASYKYNSMGTPPITQENKYYINEITLADKNLSYQIFTDCFPNHPFAIASGVKKIYKGTKYNDTCMAELNFICSDGNYLFGDINE